MTSDLILAVDGGGSGCRARLVNGTGVLAEVTGGPANLMAGDGRAPFEAVLAVARDALATAGKAPAALADCRAVLGLAGATPDARSRFFAFAPPFAETCIVSDGYAALLGAFGGEDGGIVIQGTGAAAAVLVEGRLTEIGGWGFALDDFGSGADIGRRALRAALRAHDEPGAPPPFAAAVLKAAGASPQTVMDWAQGAAPRDFAQLAPRVFDAAEHGTPEAEAILARAAEETARLVRLCAAHGAERVAVLGSVGRRIAPMLHADTAALLVEPAGDAMNGAVIALRQGLGHCA
ncbi:BadF/BadG/BcrA/BcrD ATPase family protein [Maritimibacter sp. 55A14]|uniref:BadF/BadG/BcrA/BcrD ATPase family protein n=1 Tax=Maritimibacter sp. 55A14 TaxID=2174844 RepID=UPI001304D5E7|nr:BadF/BadG/BcrA/BcrD ATPase family protein [Maritimibacter sp. 55A14]